MLTWDADFLVLNVPGNGFQDYLLLHIPRDRGEADWPVILWLLLEEWQGIETAKACTYVCFFYFACFFWAQWGILHVGDMKYVDEVWCKFFIICEFLIIQLNMFRLEFKAVYSLEWKNFVLCSLPNTMVYLSELKVLRSILLSFTYYVNFLACFEMDRHHPVSLN